MSQGLSDSASGEDHEDPVSTWRQAATRLGYGRWWDTDCFSDALQAAETCIILTFTTILLHSQPNWEFSISAHLFTDYDRVVFQADILCRLFKYT